MTTYAGELVRIQASVKDFDGAAMTNVELASVEVETYNAATGAAVLAATAMTWDATESLWVYRWDTTGVAAAKYRAKVTATDLLAGESWEWSATIDLAPSPLPGP